jgi:ABC-type glycerol-3-phosphate transport system permease component
MESPRPVLSRVDRFLPILQVYVCFFCLPPGFLAVPQYFNHVLVGSVALAITLAISSLIAYHIFREDTHQLLLYEILHINHC